MIGKASIGLLSSIVGFLLIEELLDELETTFLMTLILDRLSLEFDLTCLTICFEQAL